MINKTLYLKQPTTHTSAIKLLKRTTLSAALIGIIGSTAISPARAETIELSWNGLFTWLDSSGSALQNTSYPYYGDPTWGYGFRTPTSGTLSLDSTTGTGTGSIDSFNFLNQGTIVWHDITMQAIGDGAGGSGDLIISNMQFDWNGNNNVPVQMVLDASGLFGALGNGLNVGDSLSGVGAIPASDGIRKGLFPISSAPIATTSLNTDGIALTGDNGIGGSPMGGGPFGLSSFNFDMTTVTLHNEGDLLLSPIPAAAWLFGSGLIGLIGVARRKRKS